MMWLNVKLKLPMNTEKIAKIHCISRSFPKHFATLK